MGKAERGEMDPHIVTLEKNMMMMMMMMTMTAIFINTIYMKNCPQYTEERMGKAERTEMDPHIVTLEKKTENTKNYTTRIKDNATAVILPNPGHCHHHHPHHHHHHHHHHRLYHHHCHSHDDWLFDSPASGDSFL